MGGRLGRWCRGARGGCLRIAGLQRTPRMNRMRLMPTSQASPVSKHTAKGGRMKHRMLSKIVAQRLRGCAL